MLLNSSEVISIPYSYYYTASCKKDARELFKRQSTKLSVALPSHPTTTTRSQYLNSCVTPHLHRTKRQWKQISTSHQNTSYLPDLHESTLLFPETSPTVTRTTTKILTASRQKTIIESKPNRIHGCIGTTMANQENINKGPIELDPIHSRIQQDLLELRKSIKSRRGKLIKTNSLRTHRICHLTGRLVSYMGTDDLLKIEYYHID